MKRRVGCCNIKNVFVPVCVFACLCFGIGLAEEGGGRELCERSYLDNVVTRTFLSERLAIDMRDK